jgi:cob(I)alamin adenosyltransferase
MKVYTGKGDKGTTAGSVKGQRVAKTDIRIDAFGNIDELNSALGMLRAMMKKESSALNDEIKRIQSHLMEASALIAAWQGSKRRRRFKEIGEEQVRFLESAIDRMDKELPELNEFVVPGDHPLQALAHVTRTVCRRAERDVIRLSCETDGEDAPGKLEGVIMYLNRLSDYIFVLGRYCSHLLEGQEDGEWKE